MPQSTSVSHLVFARARIGQSDQLGARLDSLIAPSLNAPGCLEFALQHSARDPDVWLISGSWADEQAMSAWFNTPHLQVFSEIVQELIVSSLDFHTFATDDGADANVQQMLRAI
ncbi:putative quinol monooxygenase [Pseudomonas sp. G.S.17]|uniref:putative quinol monooxygenase n=1 Tax=Pseudomonas sp. G.S.17 TaxID=3137451 RepID=UPI00311CA19C